MHTSQDMKFRDQKLNNFPKFSYDAKEEVGTFGMNQ